MGFQRENEKNRQVVFVAVIDFCTSKFCRESVPVIQAAGSAAEEAPNRPAGKPEPVCLPQRCTRLINETDIHMAMREQDAIVMSAGPEDFGACPSDAAPGLPKLPQNDFCMSPFSRPWRAWEHDTGREDERFAATNI
jgi:hypothetical protein